MMTRMPNDYRGDDKLLFGIILGVLAFCSAIVSIMLTVPKGRGPEVKRA
jgi:hypothetical protein